MRVWAAIMALAVVLLPASALAQTRRAFIAAVGDYKSLTDLQKTLGDAAGYAQVFRDNLKFQVTQAPANATRAQFNAAFGQFLASIRPGDEVAFIFSGHGWSDGVENFLALSDAPRDASEYELKTETVALTASILAQINSRSPRLTLAIIDACRDNPFDNGTKAGFEKGLVRTEVAAGTMVVYAAGQRQKALDRLSTSDNAQYSLFTRVLLPKLRDPALPLMTGVDEARDEVARLAGTVNHQQRPAVYSDVSLAFCFAGACRGGAAADNDTALWVEITSSDATCADYERYRQQYPKGKYAIQANRILSRPPCAAAPAATTTPAVSASTTSAPRGAETFRDCSDCPLLVSIPAGNFQMGSPAGEADRGGDEGPQRRVSVPSFAAGKYEVTWTEYGACVSAGACPAASDDGFGKGSRPVTNVSWNDAKQYVAWLSSRTGKTYRLLSEAEWEYAARGGTTTPFSFGATISTSQANYDGRSTYANGSKGEYRQKTSPAGSFPANAFGLHDMHGNVYEWVEDCHADSYSAGQPTNGAAFTQGNCSDRVDRGGSWFDLPQNLRSAIRGGDVPTVRDFILGFRVARTL